MRLFYLFILLLLTNRAASVAFAQKPPGVPLQANVPASTSGVDFSLTPAASGYVLGEPVIMVFKARNTSAAAVNIDMGFDRKGGLSFTIIDPEQRTAHDLQLPRRGGLSRLSVVSIPAGKTYEQRFVLDEWAAFSLPGQYDVTWNGRLVPTKAQSIGAEVGGMVRFVIHPRHEAYGLAVKGISTAAGTFSTAARPTIAFAQRQARTVCCVPTKGAEQHGYLHQRGIYGGRV